MRFINLLVAIYNNKIYGQLNIVDHLMNSGL